MSNNVDIGVKKSMFILIIVIGCFSVLWPKVFYPMLIGSANQQMKPSSVDRTSGCCDVISESDVNIIKIMIELCKTVVQKSNTASKKSFISDCRSQVFEACGIDIEAMLQENIQMGQSLKHILDDVRSYNGSLCLKYNFGIDPWRLGVPHRIAVDFSKAPSIRQERPTHLNPEMLHPALRERGRAIPASNRIPPRIVEGRPGPIPGMRPPMGGAGHVVPAPKSTSTMSVVMPIYTIGIVIFFTYTLMKLMFRKPADSTNGLYPPIKSDGSFRKQVFESELSNSFITRNGKDEVSTKLGWKERDTIVNAMSALLAEVDQQQEEDAKLRAEKSRQNVTSTVTDNVANSTNISNGKVSSGYIEKKETSKQENEHDPTSVKVLGMEMTASCEGGQKWSRPNTPLVSTTPAPTEPVPPPQSIYLEGALPAQSQLLVSDSATETETTDSDTQESAVVLSGKMTLSVISLDNIDKVVKNGTDHNEDDNEVEYIMDEEGVLDDSKYTTASNTTAAEIDLSGDEDKLTDDEQDAIIEDI